jgi:hypothetical protein
MAFTDGIVCPDLLELSTANYTVAPISVYTTGIECPDLLALSSANYVATGIKAFTTGIECPNLLGLSSANYVNPGVKAFHGARDLRVSVQPVLPGDDSIEIIVGMYLDFNAVPRSGRAPLEVQFQNLSSNFFTNWLWDFGDGHTSIALNPEHKYKLPGKYNVSLEVRLYPDTFKYIKRG